MMFPSSPAVPRRSHGEADDDISISPTSSTLVQNTAECLHKIQENVKQYLTQNNEGRTEGRSEDQM